jgi:two-component system, OmpR family, sensor histidine kinase KdpD
MNALFYAVFVNGPDRFLTKAESLYVKTCEKLCQEFNGQFLRVNGTNIAKAISEVAKQYRITQIAAKASNPAGNCCCGVL